MQNLDIFHFMFKEEDTVDTIYWHNLAAWVAFNLSSCLLLIVLSAMANVIANSESWIQMAIYVV